MSIEEKRITKKPCTRVTYDLEVTDLENDETNSVEFFLHFSDPPEVKVKEEYLLYDIVAVISSIGGTMGLCIGFSFKDLTIWMMGYTKQGFRKLCKRSGHHMLDLELD